MRTGDLRQLLREDLYRYYGKLGWRAFWRAWRYEHGFRFTVWLRLCRYCHENPLTRFGIYHLVAFIQRRACIRYGVHIGFTTEIGGGLYLPHALNIVVNRRCVIGRNCNLSHGVTLGVAHRGEQAGTPAVGDNVFIGPGAVVFGRIKIGDNAAIGANSVVNKDVPPMAVVAGIPGKVTSDRGSTGYIDNTLKSDETATDS